MLRTSSAKTTTTRRQQERTVQSPGLLHGRELEAKERDDAGAYEDFRPASLATLARLGIPEIDAAEIELTPRKAIKRDGSGYWRFYEGVLDERAADSISAFAS